MDNKYAGMTVNERLWVSGLMDEFERAISQKNTDEAVRILTEVELTEENIKPILVKYGLCSELG
jgi:molecular chaperone GrpE (heat shock protein)